MRLLFARRAVAKVIPAPLRHLRRIKGEEQWEGPRNEYNFQGGGLCWRALRVFCMKRVPRLLLMMTLAASVVIIVICPARYGTAQWREYARDAQHSARTKTASKPFKRILWSTAVDEQPQLKEGGLNIHYGSPLVTAANTVIVPVKTGTSGGFELQARRATDGSLIWALPTDYILPPHDWTPVFGPTLTSKQRLYFPGAGGTVYYRDRPDSTCRGSDNCEGQVAFYGLARYQGNQRAFDSSIQINTPLSSDPSGNIYFGFVVSEKGIGLSSGIARITPRGRGAWVSATAAADDDTMTEVVQNCAPALSKNFATLYVAVSNGQAGYLVALNSATLRPKARVRLKDPLSQLDALLSDDSSAAPTVGPDGDVYFGVLENPLGENHLRGWLLHFDRSLSQSKTPAAFGWDTTASIAPKSLVRSYKSKSRYFLMTKYNDYVEGGGSGLNRIALLDPRGTEVDQVTGLTVMYEVRSIVGPTPDTAGTVKEWCINSAAVDPRTKSIVANSEDGKLYRWNPSDNVLSESIVLTPGVGEAYTPTVVGVDGTNYAINAATLFAIGE
jgi:hypothetical protein